MILSLIDAGWIYFPFSGTAFYQAFSHLQDSCNWKEDMCGYCIKTHLEALL